MPPLVPALNAPISPATRHHSHEQKEVRMVKEEVVRALEAAGVSFEPLPHAHTETAAAEAKALGLSQDEVAKTLVLTTPDGHVRAVVPASERIDMHKLREVLGVPGKKLHLASEEDLSRDYPGFELGTVPPFGGPADPVVVDRRLREQDSVVVEAGSHEDSLRVATDDLVRLTNATIADICQD
jgi:Ala-tRNA(Pro) deacylase